MNGDLGDRVAGGFQFGPDLTFEVGRVVDPGEDKIAGPLDMCGRAYSEGPCWAANSERANTPSHCLLL